MPSLLINIFPQNRLKNNYYYLSSLFCLFQSLIYMQPYPFITLTSVKKVWHFNATGKKFKCIEERGEIFSTEKEQNLQKKIFPICLRYSFKLHIRKDGWKGDKREKTRQEGYKKEGEWRECEREWLWAESRTINGTESAPKDKGNEKGKPKKLSFQSFH